MRKLSWNLRAGSTGGFTLVELLVVIAVLALLAALLFPAFAQARGKGKQAACVSNLRQIGLALNLYAADFDERFPTTRPPSPASMQSSPVNVGWAGQTYGYAKNTAVFHCGSDPTADFLRAGVNASMLYAISYALNSNLSDSASVTSLSAPASTVLLFEIARDNARILDIAEGQNPASSQVPPQTSAAGNGVNGALLNLSGISSAENHTAIYRTGVLDNSKEITPISEDNNQYPDRNGSHSEGANFLACDLHTKWLRGHRVSSGGSALLSGNPQARSGCSWNGVVAAGGLPCAEGTALSQHALTFSTN